MDKGTDPKLLFAIFALISIAAMCFLLPKYYKLKKPQNNLKKFSSDLLDALENKENLNTLKIQPKGENDMIKLYNHTDFLAIYETEFFRKWIKNIENTVIPSKKMYGFCSILTTNYEQIRQEIIQETFIYLTEHAFLNIPGVCPRDKLHEIMTHFQSVFIKNETAKDLNQADLWEVVRFMDLYSLYFLFIENPRLAMTYNFKQFCYFEEAEPSKSILQSEIP